MLLANLSWEEITEYLAREDRIILPIGATEQHGRHLGIGCDHIIAEAIANEVGAQTNVVVAPVLAYGMSHHHLEFSGTISLAPGTLAQLLEDIFRSLYRHGFRRVLVVNGHAGNLPSLQSALAVVANQLDGLRVKSFQWWTEQQILGLVEETAGKQRGAHSSPAETALLLAVRANAVKRERVARRDSPVEASREFVSARQFAQKYPDGVMGLDPSTGTSELGKMMLKKSVAICIEEIENW